MNVISTHVMTNNWQKIIVLHLLVHKIGNLSTIGIKLAFRRCSPFPFTLRIFFVKITRLLKLFPGLQLQIAGITSGAKKFARDMAMVPDLPIIFGKLLPTRPTSNGGVKIKLLLGSQMGHWLLLTKNFTNQMVLFADVIIKIFHHVLS